MNLNKILKSIQLNDTEKQIVHYLKEHIKDVSHIGIQKVADDNWTSTSSVFRLCQKLGFSGYKEFVYYMNSHMMTNAIVTDERDVLNLARQITMTLSSNEFELSHLLQTIDATSSFLIIANGYAAILGEYLAKKLIVYGYRVIQINASGSYKIIENNLNHLTHIIVLTRSGETKSLITILKKFPIQDKILICFTQEVSSTMSECADITFEIVDENQGDWDNINYSQFHPILLFFIEYLLSKLQMLDK